jgi:hypothetical protein
VLHAAIASCATTGTTTQAPSGSVTAEPSPPAEQHLAVEMPAEAAEVRMNASAPILSVVTSGEVVFAYVYGYPLYPEGDAVRGIAELR